MKYEKYYHLCKLEYKKDFPHIETSLYDSRVKIHEVGVFSNTFYSTVEVLAQKIKEDLNLVDDNFMPQHKDIFKFKKELNFLANEIVPMLEETQFGCYLYVDKVYIYRTAPVKKRESSYLWHHDNNPNEILKNCIYLNEVTDKNSPFEYLTNKDGKPALIKSTREGKGKWVKKLDTRLDSEVSRLVTENDYITKKVFGKTGLVTSFLNNVIHRANPVIEGYRDVINIRVKPTLVKPPRYIDKEWTTSFETSGTVDKDPRKDWRSKK
jgi:hypothetical protein